MDYSFPPILSTWFLFILSTTPPLGGGGGFVLGLIVFLHRTGKVHNYCLKLLANNVITIEKKGIFNVSFFFSLHCKRLLCLLWGKRILFISLCTSCAPCTSIDILALCCDIKTLSRCPWEPSSPQLPIPFVFWLFPVLQGFRESICDGKRTFHNEAKSKEIKANELLHWFHGYCSWYKVSKLPTNCPMLWDS